MIDKSLSVPYYYKSIKAVVKPATTEKCIRPLYYAIGFPVISFYDFPVILM
jgi:hypothetical protein